METIAALVRERITQPLPAVTRRAEIMGELPRPKRFNRVHIVTGMHRSGKTFYLHQRMHDLLAAGIPRESMLYFDFSDNRLPDDAGANIMDLVLDEYWRQNPRTREAGAYLFLDEVQDCAGWQGTCRRIAENENVALVITGSSSKMSSEEIATEFRGRSHTHEMLPLSFAEFVNFHADILPDGTSAAALGNAQALSPQERTALECLFDSYLIVGGFPAIQNDDPSTRIEILQGYVRDVVAQDVAERAARPSIGLATQLALMMLRNTSCETSVNGLVDALRSAGNRIGRERADELMGLFRQAFLYFEVAEYSHGLMSGGTNPPKAYAVDPGLAYAVSRANRQDIGKRLETAVYLELRRRLKGRRTDVICSYTAPGAPRKG